MHPPGKFKERRKHPRFPIGLPLEFWERGGPSHGAVICNLSEGGLLIHSLEDMLVGTELEIRVFFADEYKLDQFKATARIVWKDHHVETDWKGYKYALEFVDMPQEDRHKLIKIINAHLSMDDISDGLRTGRLSLPSLFS